jgi:hypothetical protein
MEDPVIEKEIPAIGGQDVFEEPVGEELTPRQKKFCELYASDREFFGNGAQSYIEVYEVDKTKPNWYKTVCSSASRLLSYAKVYNYINSLLETDGLNDQNVDKQMLFLINQHADFNGKTAAIREYNKLKSRIVQRIDHTTLGKEMPSPIYAGQSKDV